MISLAAASTRPPPLILRLHLLISLAKLASRLLPGLSALFVSNLHLLVYEPLRPISRTELFGSLGDADSTSYNSS